MMTKEEEKPVFGYQRPGHYYENDPQFNQVHHPAYDPVYADPRPGYPSNPPGAQPYQYYDYNYPARPLPYVAPETSQGFSFCRVMLCLMLFLVIFTLLTSIFTYSVFMTLKPKFMLDSFVVHTFNISGDGGPGTTLKANWETKVSVKNMNHRSSVQVKHAEAMLVYRYAVLDSSTVENVEIERESTVHILDAFSFPNSKQSVNADSVATDISNDRQRGQIMFDMKLEVLFVIKSHVFRKNEKMRYFCERITLNFPNGSSNVPTWSGPSLECVAGL